MKLVNNLVALCFAGVLTSVFASPLKDESATQSSAQLSSGIPGIAAKFYPGAIAAIAKLNPDAAQKVDAAAKEACDAVKDLDTDNAQLKQDTSSSILSPITGLVSSFVSSILPTITPALTAVLAVATGDTSSAPALVALAQQTCDIVFNGAQAATGQATSAAAGSAPGVLGTVGSLVNGIL